MYLMYLWELIETKRLQKINCSQLTEKWKRIFLTCPHQKNDREEAVCFSIMLFIRKMLEPLTSCECDTRIRRMWIKSTGNLVVNEDEGLWSHFEWQIHKFFFFLGGGVGVVVFMNFLIILTIQLIYSRYPFSIPCFDLGFVCMWVCKKFYNFLWINHQNTKLCNELSFC